MRRFCVALMMLAASVGVWGQDRFNKIPRAWKWINFEEVIFSYDGTYEDSTAFVFNATEGRFDYGRTAPEKFADFPLHPLGAVNLTYSPDSTMLAFTRDNDLWVADIATGEETRLTFDGTDLILNGYASWVYFEEILGRATKYKAFWWSPDSRKIGFYRFDNTQVPFFPIYSAVGQDGSLRQTRYPKAGETNPQVRIGIVDLAAVRGVGEGSEAGSEGPADVVWADFDPTLDQYFGTPFWGDDSGELYVARMPRVQNTLDLYAVSSADGSKRHVYSETYGTWLDWIDDVIFTDSGLYMARSFETGWEQIYFLSYDGSEFHRLTDGRNWDVSLERACEKRGEVYFTAQRDSRVRSALYKVDRKGVVTALTDTALNVMRVSFSPDGRYFAAALSNAVTPTKVVVASTSRGISNPPGPAPECTVVADMAPADFDPAEFALPQLVWMTTEDGFRIPAQITYPKDFDPSQKYPVHVDIYGGPNTPMVLDRWVTPSESNQWWSENGIIEVTADCTASGHNGREGTDLVHLDLVSRPIKDFVAWAGWLKALPYVQGDKIGVEGFSFGGTMTTALLCKAPDSYHYGIAGGGVYDWMLYDSHYTERFMDTPERNPDGYSTARVLNYVADYPVTYGDGAEAASSGESRGISNPSETGQEPSPANLPAPVMLRVTHGTGDDNVHFQNTLQLIDVMQKHCKNFELMIYPDGMHGYRGYQGEHFKEGNRAFWLKYLKNQ